MIIIRVPLISQNVTEGLHNGFLGAILCQSHPKKISDFYLHFWPLAPHFGGAVGANGKTAQKWLKKYQIFKLAENPSKSWKRLKPNAIPSFFGDVGLIKAVLEFLFGQPKCPFLVPEYRLSLWDLVSIQCLCFWPLRSIFVASSLSCQLSLSLSVSQCPTNSVSQRILHKKHITKIQWEPKRQTLSHKKYFFRNHIELF